MQEDVMIEVIERVAEPEVRVKTVPEVLRHAALVIEERGWRQGTYVGSDGSVCALGALGVAFANDPMFDGPIGVDGKPTPQVYLDATESLPTSNVAEWNDTPGRTAAEVTAALRAAADAYETGPVRP